MAPAYEDDSVEYMFPKLLLFSTMSRVSSAALPGSGLLRLLTLNAMRRS